LFDKPQQLEFWDIRPLFLVDHLFFMVICIIVWSTATIRILRYPSAVHISYVFINIHWQRFQAYKGQTRTSSTIKKQHYTEMKKERDKLGNVFDSHFKRMDSWVRTKEENRRYINLVCTKRFWNNLHQVHRKVN
jgi:hypothetical protein